MTKLQMYDLEPIIEKMVDALIEESLWYVL